MQQLKEAVDNGFDLRHAIGRKWARALSKDKTLQEEHKALGKGYAKQRDLRMAWAKASTDELEVRSPPGRIPSDFNYLETRRGGLSRRSAVPSASGAA